MREGVLWVLRLLVCLFVRSFMYISHMYGFSFYCFAEAFVITRSYLCIYNRKEYKAHYFLHLYRSEVCKKYKKLENKKISIIKDKREKIREETVESKSYGVNNKTWVFGCFFMWHFLAFVFFIWHCWFSFMNFPEKNRLCYNPMLIFLYIKCIFIP